MFLITFMMYGLLTYINQTATQQHKNTNDYIMVTESSTTKDRYDLNNMQSSTTESKTFVIFQTIKKLSSPKNSPLDYNFELKLRHICIFTKWHYKN